MLQPAAPNDEGPNVKNINFMDVSPGELYIPPVSFVFHLLTYFLGGF
jgi:hypothetical protein